MLDKIGLKNAVQDFVLAQWSNYRQIRDDTLPDISIVAFNPKSEELSIPFPIVTILPEEVSISKTVGRVLEKEYSFALTMFNLGTYDYGDIDLLLHFANAIILDTPRRIQATVFDFEAKEEVQKSVVISITGEKYNLTSYGSETLLFSAELTATLRL